MENMYNKSELAKRGWTESLIARFFPVPTQYRRNPYYRKAAPMKLYDKHRIHAIEATEAFQKASEKAKKRSAVSISSARKRGEETDRWVESLPTPEIPFFAEAQLRALAVDHYNNLWDERGRPEKHSTVTDDPAFLARLCVNYLRHQQSDYEARLVEASGRVGADEARDWIRREVLLEIAVTYPHLAEECKQQAKRKQGY